MLISEVNGRVSQLRGKGNVIDTIVLEDRYGFKYHRLSASPVPLENIPVMLCHPLAVLSQIATTKFVIVCRVLRTMPHRPFSLESIQCVSVPPVALFIFEPLFPRLVSVLAKGFNTPVRISHHSLAAHYDKAGLWHEKKSVTEFLPMVR
jgi:hypothetical protein